MKQLLILAILICSISVSAQSHLPDTIRIKLTASQIQAIANKIDSLQTTLTMTSTMPSSTISQFNQRVNIVFAPLWAQIQKQLVADKPKEVKK